MRRLTVVAVCALLATVTVEGASQFDWANYDSAKPVALSGMLVAAQTIDGYVTIKINLNPKRYPEDSWRVVLGTPKELKATGLELVLLLGEPAKAVVWQHKSIEK